MRSHVDSHHTHIRSDWGERSEGTVGLKPTWFVNSAGQMIGVNIQYQIG
jgi:hypothetical protein